jgi:hypothetical protein
MKEDFTSTKSPWKNMRLVRKVLILAVLVACAALISSESPADAASASCSELFTDFSNASWGYSDAYQLTQGNPTTCSADCLASTVPFLPSAYFACVQNCEASRQNGYAAAESALFSASSALAGTCAMEQPEFCPGAYDRAAQCSAQWDYWGIEDQEYHDYVYNQYMACMAASGIYTCV